MEVVLTPSVPTVMMTSKMVRAIETKLEMNEAIALSVFFRSKKCCSACLIFLISQAPTM